VMEVINLKQRYRKWSIKNGNLILSSYLNNDTLSNKFVDDEYVIEKLNYDSLVIKSQSAKFKLGRKSHSWKNSKSRKRRR